MPKTKEKRLQLQDSLSFVNKDGDFIIGSDWLYYKFTSYKDGYDALCQLINILIKH